RERVVAGGCNRQTHITRLYIERGQEHVAVLPHLPVPDVIEAGEGGDLTAHCRHLTDRVARQRLYSHRARPNRRPAATSSDPVSTRPQECQAHGPQWPHVTAGCRVPP